jgi:predicted NBD/HSP70 family sugar kinase
MKVIGIDIGGTKTSIGIVDITKGKVISKIIISSKKFKSDKKNLNSIIYNTINLIDKKNIKYIGIGVPELINNKGIIKGNYNFKWNNKNLINFFPNKFKVVVDSDVRCHLRAEKFYGHGKKLKNFIYLNIGTGLSYSHFKDNKIYSGANGYAIHFASSKITLYNPLNNKKISLTPEELYSGKAIMSFLKKYKNTKIQNVILKNIAESLGSLIGNLINSVDPGAAVMGGGVIINNSKFKNLLIKYSRNYILSEDVKKIKFLTSKLKNDTGLLGAAAIFK